MTTIYPIYKISTGELSLEKYGRMFVKFTGPERGFKIHTDKNYKDLTNTGWDECCSLIEHTQGFWRDPKDVEEWLLFLPRPYGELAVKRLKEDAEYFSKHGYGFAAIESPQDALMESFDWAETAEGHEFWDLVHGAVEESEYPKIPETPEIKQKEETETKKLHIYTELKPGLIDLALSVLEGKGKTQNSPPSPEKLLVFAEEGYGDTDFQLWQCDNLYLGGYTKVSTAEFIKLISALPDKKKEKEPLYLRETPVPGMVTELCPAVIKIGCQKLTYEQWSALKKQISDWRETKIKATQDYSITLRPQGIHVECEGNVDWADFDNLSRQIEDYYAE